MLRFVRLGRRLKRTKGILRNNSTTSEPVDFNKLMLRRTVVTRFWTALAVVGGGVASYIYFYDMENTSERKLGEVLNLIKNEDASYKKAGFEEIYSSLFTTKRVFSGLIGIPVSKELLISKDVISAVYDNIDNSSDEISMSALGLLNKLATKRKDEIQSLILEIDPGFQRLLTVMLNDDLSNSRRWIAASAIILAAENDKQSFAGTSKFSALLSKLGSSSSPLALATGIRLARFLPHGAEIPDKLQQVVNSTDPRLVDSIITVGRSHVPEVKRNISRGFGPTATALSTLCFGLLGAIYGRIMWFARVKAASSTVYTAETKQLFLRSRRFNHYLFLFLLVGDFAASLTLRFANELNLSPSEQQVVPPSLYPMIQTMLFTIGTVALIHVQRFVVLPLLLTGSYYHMDVLRRFPTIDYVVGKAQADTKHWCKTIKNKIAEQSTSALRRSS